MNLSNYSLVETKSQIEIGGRVLHSFVYEKDNLTFGNEGKMRFKLEVNGDSLTSLIHTIKIPESFERKYEEMRSYNLFIALIATAVVLIFVAISIILWGKFSYQGIFKK